MLSLGFFFNSVRMNKSIANLYAEEFTTSLHGCILRLLGSRSFDYI